MIEIDGSWGEGGGQVLRTTLALSLVTATPVRVVNVRARREKPGLRLQHVAALKAAARVGSAEVTGADVGSSVVTFRPGAINAGRYDLAIGSAGSTTLVLATILPALLGASGRSTVSIEGGTHNPLAPPFEFLERAFLPLIASMGPRVRLRLERHGFYPRGGGRIVAEIEPAPLAPIHLLERGAIRAVRARASVASLERSIAEREAQTLARALKLDRSPTIEIEELDDAFGPGNFIIIDVECEHAREVFSAIGEKGVRAEEVARRAADEAKRFVAANVPVGEHLADQLLLPLALAGGGAFRTSGLTLHATTQIDLIPRFLAVRFDVADDRGAVLVRVSKTT